MDSRDQSRKVLRNQQMFELVRNITNRGEGGQDAGRLVCDWVPIEGIPPLGLVGGEPILGSRRGTGRHKRAVGVRSTRVSQVVVEIALLPTLDKAVQVSSELFKPTRDQGFAVYFDRLCLGDFRLFDNNSADNDSVARNSDMLEGPAITQELGAKVPFLSPIMLQALSSLFVSDDGASVALAEHIESTNVDKGITANWMAGEPREVEWDREREFKCCAIGAEIRLYPISSSRVSCKVGLDGSPHILSSLWICIPRRDGIAPFVGESGVCAGKRERFVSGVVE